MKLRLPAAITLDVVVLLIAGADLVAGPRGDLSRVATVVGIALVVPWLAHARPPTDAAAAARRRIDALSLWKRFLTIAVPVATILACVYAKWLVLHTSPLPDEVATHAAVYRTYAAVALVAAALGITGAHRVQEFLGRMADHPARLTLVSFAVMGVVGAVVLTLPQSLRDPSKASFVDGLFHATSALCVTGLSVGSIPGSYTTFGQAVLLALVQIGGLGVMVLSAFFGIVVGQRMRARATAVMAEMIDAESFASFRRTVLTIVLATFAAEAVGAVLLYGLFQQYVDAGLPASADLPLAGAGDLWWAAVFHAVSAFCNAGFSLFRDGLVPFHASPVVCLVFMGLIVAGGLGFPVFAELVKNGWTRLRGRRPPRMSLHARAVLVTTAALTVIGFVAMLVLEWGHSMAGLGVGEKLLAALFQSVTLRTAGFNTVDFARMQAATLFVSCGLMIVGGSPGSTAGGIKTTTLFVLVAALRAELAGFTKPRMFGRSISAISVRRATAVAVLSIAMVSGIFLALLVLEPHATEKLLFETVSAFATVGLSANLTPSLSTPGKLVIIGAMFVGRVGPMTLALALAARSGTQRVELPEERVGIG